jgi:A/G-specific adenine glycosylase
MTDFHLLITDWYRLNKRELPWRLTNDPYKIWLSEIILQQTRVDQGLNYYLKFTKHYPSIYDLASADEQQVLRDWQGLGYYSRARNLHFTAKSIVKDLNGQFPSTFDEIIKLKGIGEYTAAAIASFSFNETKAVVDGNVYRVLSRFFDIDLAIDSTTGKKYFSELAQELINSNNPANHNQAIMELGALVCKPMQPNCLECPLNESCKALSQNTITLRPVKEKKTKVRNRYFSFLVFELTEEIIIEQRIGKDIWTNLYQFPLIETSKTTTIVEIKSLTGLTPNFCSDEIIHILSHQRLHAKFYHFYQIPTVLENEWIKIKKSELDDYPLPRLIDRYLESQH